MFVMLFINGQNKHLCVELLEQIYNCERKAPGCQSIFTCVITKHAILASSNSDDDDDDERSQTTETFLSVGTSTEV